MARNAICQQVLILTLWLVVVYYWPVPSVEESDQSSQQPAVASSKLYNLDDAVKVWSDFLHPHMHPRSVHIIDAYQHNRQVQRWPSPASDDSRHTPHLCQSYPSLSASDSPLPAAVTSSFSADSPLASSVTPLLFHSWHKTNCFTICSHHRLSSSLRTASTKYCPNHIFWENQFFVFSSFPYFPVFEFPAVD